MLVGLLSVSAVFSEKADAQGVFCPANISTPAGGASGAGIRASEGTCTNGSTGAFSGAALASQTLGNLASTSSQTSTATTTRALANRREAETMACPAGQSRVGNACVADRPREPAAAAAPAPEPARTRVSKKSKTRKAVQTARAPRVYQPVFKSDLPNLATEAAHYGSWIQAYGDYEHRDGTQTSSFLCCTVPGQAAIPVTIQASSETKTWGVVGGLDWTGRGFTNAGDGVMIGVMGGYMESSVRVNTTVISGDPNRAASGSSRFNGKLNGPSVGGYVSYFNGPFSNDFLVKADFLNLNENYTDNLGFGLCTCFLALGVSPIAYNVQQAGNGSTSVNMVTISDFVSYRIPVSATTWLEPTGGIRFTNSSYDSSAVLLGLKDGYSIRLQGGLRVGFSGLFDQRLTTTITGLIFDDVVVHGNFIQGGVFGTSGNILNTEGKVQGQGIFAFNYDLGNNTSTYVQADVRGGDGVFGVGGKGGVRVRW